MQSPIILVLGLLTITASLLRMWIVRGKPTFENDRVKKTYYGLTAAACLPGVPCFVLLMRSLERPTWAPALGLLALSMILFALIDRKYVPETREHRLYGVMAVLMIGLALFFHASDVIS
ncbi:MULTISPECIES: hypothetical protein [Saccharibacillus]|uniref:hypothetical protein n=1 Tax=Saccharibacillus TaxID=456492 RepID=UPI0012399A6B|nr:hypothetical protein [Saccharibacillus sp. WB 17]MWJ30924.1 hypothetical protein [Saccharibacillus sp. WB 17]